MTKWPVQKLTHRTTQKRVQYHGATDIKKKNYIFVFYVLILRALVVVFACLQKRYPDNIHSLILMCITSLLKGRFE